MALLVLALLAGALATGGAGHLGDTGHSAGSGASRLALSAPVPTWWECATCLRCEVDTTVEAPPAERWDTLGACPHCTGCSHRLEMLNLTVPLPRLSVRSVRMHPGNTGASIFLATDGGGQQAVLKMHGIVSSMVAPGKLNQLVTLYKGRHYLGDELEVGYALSQLASECGLGHVSINEWLASVRGVVPFTGEKLYDEHVLLADYARGASLEMLTIKLPSADLLRLLAAIPHTSVRDAALFDVLFLQSDRHGENVFVTDDGYFKLIDSRDGAFGEGLDTVFLATTVVFERNRVGNERMYNSSRAAVSHHWPQNTLDYRCHVPGGAIGRNLPPRVRSCVDKLAGMTVDHVVDTYFRPAGMLPPTATATDSQERQGLLQRTKKRAQVVLHQAIALRDHGFERTLELTMHKNATGLLHSPAGFPPHPPCCAVRLTDPTRNAYECAPDGHKSLVDAPLEAPAAGAAASPPAATGNASNRAAWAARIGGGGAAIVEAGGDVFDTIPAYGFPDPGYKNPCWRNASGLWCIPAFHIIGVSKCGTTDLYRRLVLHPHVAKSHNKGPHFWDEGHSFDWYLRLFDVSAAAIGLQPGTVVVGDASSNTLTYSGVGVRSRRSPPQGGGVTLPQVLAALQPRLRMVALLRNPRERLLSAFHYYRHYAVIHGATPAGFHAFALGQVDAFRSACVDAASPLECRQRGYARAEQLTKGLYALFLPDFWAAFPLEQLLILRTEVYGNATEASLARVLGHLDLEKPEAGVWAAMLAARRSNTRAGNDATRQMLPETRALLDDFYRPYNEELARLLGDDSYLEWHNATP